MSETNYKLTEQEFKSFGKGPVPNVTNCCHKSIADSKRIIRGVRRPFFWFSNKDYTLKDKKIKKDQIMIDINTGKIT